MRHHRKRNRKGGFLPLLLPAISALGTVAGAAASGLGLYSAIKKLRDGKGRRGGRRFVLHNPTPYIGGCKGKPCKPCKMKRCGGSALGGVYYKNPTYGIPIL
jgi:hypothetical protein